MSNNLADLIAAASAWADQDPDLETRAELEELIDKRDVAALSSRFDGRLEFGTAGLRGELGAGSNRMNRVLVAQAAAGIAKFLLTQPEFNSDVEPPSVVIGFDGRINSAVFARDSAQILAGAGIRAYLFDGVVPTPVLAFAGKHLNTSAAIMVTASHNPPRDNGYKVYLGGSNGGSQIISPTDKIIAGHIAEVAKTKTFNEINKSDKFEMVGDELRQAYVAETASLTGEVIEGDKVRIAYTAMHGVGWNTVDALFASVGLAKPETVTAQLLPDGNFPTVAFPNPEEPGAMDLALEVGRERHADLILANDPDADRLALAIKDSSSPTGFIQLTCDEVGLLLCHELARRAVADRRKGNLACSIVSSSALSKVAKHYGFGFRETLTGFKWISKVPDLIFGFEEALGYCVDAEHTPDKDGISAALIIADLANRLASQGKTIADRLDDLGALFGHYATGQISIRVTDLSIIANLMNKLREETPSVIDGTQAAFRDLALGGNGLAPTDGVRFDLADGRRVIVRPSGTEPKLKCYLQAIGSNQGEAKEKLAALRAAMLTILQ
jgi:phosphomannomutase